MDGGFAEYTVVPATNVYPINSPLSDIELATFPCSYSRAENMLTKGRYLSCGAIGNPMVFLDLRDLIYKDLEMIGATRLESEVFKRLVKYIKEGLLQPLVAKIFHLSEIKEAQDFF